MNLTNIYNLPDAIVRAVKNDPYDPGTCDITVTKLISSPRKVQLEKRHAKELTEDVSERIWALMGQAIHRVLERAEVEAITEKRLSIERQGSVISGQFDRLVVQDGLLQDYKLTSVYAVRDGAKAEWEAQLNVLATILREHGYVVKALEAVVILRDWSKSRVGNGDYPDAPIMTISVPMWSEEKAECYIDERIRLHQMAEFELPECSPEERWYTGDSWALMKEGRKTAVRVFSSEDEASCALVAAGEKHYVDHRPGRNIRCDGYCCVARFCEQCQKP
jgi:hypothetical protein